MSDTFHAEIYCRAADQHLFVEPGGFTVQEEDIPDFPNCVMVADNLCTLTQIAELPDDVPYFGSTESAQEFDATRFACDGQKYVEHNVSNDSDCFPVRIDANGDPDPAELAKVKEYVLHEKRVIEMLKSTAAAAAETNQPDSVSDERNEGKE